MTHYWAVHDGNWGCQTTETEEPNTTFWPEGCEYYPVDRMRKPHEEFDRVSLSWQPNTGYLQDLKWEEAKAYRQRTTYGPVPTNLGDMDGGQGTINALNMLIHLGGNQLVTMADNHRIPHTPEQLADALGAVCAHFVRCHADSQAVRRAIYASKTLDDLDAITVD